MKEPEQLHGAASGFSVTLAVEKESVEPDQLTEETDAEKSETRHERKVARRV
jgi:hypothetical protein